jgi:hypothetical protein
LDTAGILRQNLYGAGTDVPQANNSHRYFHPDTLPTGFCASFISGL